MSDVTVSHSGLGYCMCVWGVCTCIRYKEHLSKYTLSWLHVKSPYYTGCIEKKTHINYFMNVDIPWISIVTIATVLTVVTNVW